LRSATSGIRRAKSHGLRLLRSLIVSISRGVAAVRFATTSTRVLGCSSVLAPSIVEAVPPSVPPPRSEGKRASGRPRRPSASPSRTARTGSTRAAPTMPADECRATRPEVPAGPAECRHARGALHGGAFTWWVPIADRSRFAPRVNGAAPAGSCGIAVGVDLPALRWRVWYARLPRQPGSRPRRRRRRVGVEVGPGSVTITGVRDRPVRGNGSPGQAPSRMGDPGRARRDRPRARRRPPGRGQASTPRPAGTPAP
jgi:hypothetical protein